MIMRTGPIIIITVVLVLLACRHHRISRRPPRIRLLADPQGVSKLVSRDELPVWGVVDSVIHACPASETPRHGHGVRPRGSPDSGDR